jgi:chromosome segregation ATPase
LYARSLSGFRNWWLHRSFSLAAGEAQSDAPEALRDAALQFSSRVWDIAKLQAEERLGQERAAVQERVAEANAKVAAAVLARGRAENHAAQLEKKFGTAERSIQELKQDLEDAGAREKVRKAEAERLLMDRADLERRLQASELREADLQKEIQALRVHIDALEADADKHQEQQQQQLDKAKQHYASLEGRLASLLEEHKSARQGFEKSTKHRN